MENKPYFTKIRGEYQLASERSSELYRNIAQALQPNLKGVVTDFGNGGIINYDTSGLSKVICIDIINEQKDLSESRIDHIYGDFYNLKLERDSDCFLAQFLLHHLTDDEKVLSSLRNIKGKLNPDGKLIVVEIDLPPWVERMQAILLPALKRVLSLMHKPQIRFFSSGRLIRLLEDAGFENISLQTIPIGKKVSPAPVLFPRMQIPGKLYPFRIIMLKARL